MSYLDNLESNLKALERLEEQDPERQKELAERRESERAAALAVAPVAEALKSGPFTDHLLAACRVLGHQRRTLIRTTWLQSTLRLETREKRLDLVPTPGGVEARTGNTAQRLTLQEDPVKLLQDWLDG